MDLYTFLDRLIWQCYVYIKIFDLGRNTIVARGFADDLLTGSLSLILKYNVITFCLVDEDSILINVRLKDK